MFLFEKTIFTRRMSKNICKPAVRITRRAVNWKFAKGFSEIKKPNTLIGGNVIVKPKRLI
jgi:hypothetical protein